MLPSEPLSVFRVFSNGFKSYAKVFNSILPITGLFAFLHFIGKSLSISDTKWVALSSLLFFILSFLCFCWGICFVYKFLTSGELSYKDSLKYSLERSLKVAGLFIIGVMAIFLLASFFGNAMGFISAEKSGYLLMSFSLVIALFSPMFCFILVSTLDALTKGLDFLGALQNGIKVSFNLESMWRILSFLMLMLMLTVLLVVPVLFVTLLLDQLHFPEVFAIKIVVLIVFFTLVIVWIPLKINILVHVYNDLVLRFEVRVKKGKGSNFDIRQ